MPCYFAGVTVFGFVGGSHFAGPAGPAELTAAGAALIFADMARLPELVAGWRANGAAREREWRENPTTTA